MNHKKPASAGYSGSLYKLPAFLLLAILPILLSLNNTHHRTDTPVNPRTIPEYDSVAGVVMYWNPGSSNYDQIVTAVVNGIQSQATVFLQTNNTGHQQNMINTFNAHGVPMNNIVFIDVYGDRIWIRDHGPFSIYDNDSLAFVGFDDLAANHGDKDLPERLANYWDINYYDFPHIIFDGGNYLVDRHNRLFATNRLYTNNPQIPQHHIDTILEAFMGIEHITTFLPMSDDYWGHLDMQIKLLNDTTFIISTVDTWHADYTILQDNYSILQSIQHPEGKTYQIVQIPKAQNWKTYINSLIVNNVVLVPIYNDPADAFALQAYQDLLPEKTIIGINCNSMIGWGGAIHCITNQIPPFEAVLDDDDDDNGDDDNGDDDNGDDDNGDDDNGDDDNGDDDGDETNIRDIDRGVLADSFRVYPNPASDLAMVDFTITRSGDYVLEVIDMRGQIVRRTNIPALYLGDYSVPIEVSGWESGMYVIRLSSRTDALTLRLMVQ